MFLPQDKGQKRIDFREADAQQSVRPEGDSGTAVPPLFPRLRRHPFLLLLYPLSGFGWWSAMKRSGYIEGLTRLFHYQLGLRFRPQTCIQNERAQPKEEKLLERQAALIVVQYTQCLGAKDRSGVVKDRKDIVPRTVPGEPSLRTVLHQGMKKG